MTLIFSKLTYGFLLPLVFILHFITAVGIFISKTNAAISSKKIISFLKRNQPYFND